MRDEQSTGSSEIAALAQRVETARGKLPLQHDAALFEVLSESEIGAERELAEWVRAQRRKQRRRAVEEELAAEKRDRRSAATIRRADEADERWHRKALAARRRVSSEDARLAQLYRRAEWSSRALIAVVVLGMVWAGVNVQHNLVPSGDMTDPLYWLSYGIEAMISIPIITIMVAATTAARWGRELARGKVVFFETALLGTTIALNAGPHLASGSFGRAAEYAIAPVMVGVVIWLHAWVSARYALLIDGAPVVDRDATVVRHRVSDRDARVGFTVDAPDDRRWLLSGVDPYAATTTAGLPGVAVEDVDRLSDRPRDEHAEPVITSSANGHAVRSFSADVARPLADEDRPSTDGHAVQASSAVPAHQLTDAPDVARPSANGRPVRTFPADTAHTLTDAPNDGNARPATNGHALHASSTNTTQQLPDAPSDYNSRSATNEDAMQAVLADFADRLADTRGDDSRPSTNGHAVRAVPADNHHRSPVEAHRSTDGEFAIPFSAINGHSLPVEPSDSRSAEPADNAHPSTNGHAAASGHTVANGHSATNGHAVTNGHAGQAVSADNHHHAPVEAHRSTDGEFAIPFSAINGHAANGPAVTNGNSSIGNGHAVINGHAAQAVPADAQHQEHSPVRTHESTDGTDATPTSAINGHSVPVEPSNSRPAAPIDNAHSPANRHAVTNGNSSITNGHAVTNGPAIADDTSPTDGRPVNGINRGTLTNGDTAQTNGHAVDSGPVVPASGHPVTNGHGRIDSDRLSTNGQPVDGISHTSNNSDPAQTNGRAVDGDRAVPTNGHAVTNGHGLADSGRTLPINGQPINGSDRTPANGGTAQSEGNAVDGGRVVPAVDQTRLNGHALQLFPVNGIRRTDPGTPAPETSTNAHRGDEPAEPHTGDPIRKAAATIADTVAQAISGEPIARPTTNRRKSAAPSVSDAEVEQLVFDENLAPPRPILRAEPASIIARAPIEVEPESVDDEDEIDEGDEITALAHEIARRGMSNLSVEQLTQIFRLADESWLTPGIANEVGVSRAAVARAVEAGIKVRRPYAISG